MGFGDVFAGWQEAAGQHYKNLLQMDYENKHTIAQQYSQIAQDPRYDEETQQEAQRRALHTLTFEPGKKLPKEYENFIFQRKAPPPVNAPGGQGAENMPIGQQLSGPGSPTPPSAASVQGGAVPELPGPSTSGPEPQAPPNTGATGSMAAQTIQAPAPPPQMMGPMPFAQQVARTGQEAVAKSAGQFGIAGMKAAIPQKQGVDTVQGDDGRRYHSYIYQRRNPDTGIVERFNIQEDQPLGFFAPRSGAVNTVANLIKWQGEGNKVLNNDGKPLDLSTMDPNAVLQHIGEDRYVPVTEKKELRDIGGKETPFSPVAGVAGEPIGLAQGSLPRVNTRQQEIPLPGGRLGVGTFSSTSQAVPQGPTPPPGATAAPTAPPTAGVPDLTSGPTPEAVQFVMSQNPTLTKEQVTSALEQNRKASGQAAPAPTAPPTAKPSVSELPNAGHGLTAQQVLTVQKQGSALTNTVERMTNVLSKADLLKSLVTAGKVAFAVDPSQSKLLISRMTGLTPDETSLAKDYASLSEDINILRTVYGIAPSRGQQAFQALQLQKGALLGDVGVFKGTLQNTLKSVVDQMTPMNQQLAPAKQSIPFGSGIAKAYLLMNGMDKAKARAAAEKDGWQVP